jgi:hypothetical protein
MSVDIPLNEKPENPVEGDTHYNTELEATSFT